MDTAPNENYTFIIQIANPIYNLFHIRTQLTKAILKFKVIHQS